ncbi:MAG: site-specific integrase [Myxococcales bacterium]
MAFRIRPHRKRGKIDGLEVDISIKLPDGTTRRERRRSPAPNRSGAEKWAAARERELFAEALKPKPVARRDIPTLDEFWSRFVSDHVDANAHKPSGKESKEYGYRRILSPRLGSRRLVEIDDQAVIDLKTWMRAEGLAPATANNTLSLLSMVLKVAVQWRVIDAIPCRIPRLKGAAMLPKFYDFKELDRLVVAARGLDPRAELVILLGADAGLRAGEITALERSRCDTRLGQIRVELSEWKGHVTPTKGMESRVVPMTARLRKAIKAYDHGQDSPRLLLGERGGASHRVLRDWSRKAQDAAGLKGGKGELHILRHTFCSHLAMKGVPAITVQHLAGHKSLTTTLRYMHLAPGEASRAIKILESARPNP